MNATMLPFKNLEYYRGLPPRTVISFSGGRTSAYQLYHIVEANGGLPKDVVVLFQNTGLELPETLDFVQQVGEYLSVPITWLEWSSTKEHQIRLVNHNSASRAGEPFLDLFTHVVPRRRDGTPGKRPLPYPSQRVCTAELKIRLMTKYVKKHLGWSSKFYNVLGFRQDEERRALRRFSADMSRAPYWGGIGLFPMYEAGADVDDVMAFWNAAPFDLGIESNAGNCTFCFMKSVWKIKMLMLQYPQQVPLWIQMEETPRDGNAVFRRGRPTYRQLWDEVQAGNMAATNDQLVCGTCTD